ncbi:MAG: zf-HC2 domain-containing protein [Pyrinomonadaceae bacterium]
MNCENLQLNLSIYLDDVLTDDERQTIDGHLAQCPLCRQKLADFQAIRRDLRIMPRPQAPAQLLNSVRSRVAEELGARQSKTPFSEKLTELKHRFLMPYAIGTAATFVFGSLLLWALLSATNGNQENFAKYQETEQQTVLLASNRNPIRAEEFDLNPADFARERLMVSSESPSVNPQGALVALTKSFMRGEMKDEEVVVVADVFGDGLAQIAEVVEPSKDRRAVRELEKALKTNPDYAPPFVPANLDKRSDSIRVVLKFQTVNVDTNSASN